MNGSAHEGAPSARQAAAGGRGTILLTVVSGGLRSPSSTRLLADELAEAAQAALEEAGAAVEIRRVELRDHAHPIVDALLTGFPIGPLKEALADVTSADALIVVTPTFQASYGGLFKSFMDLIEAGTLQGMPVVLAATGGTERHSLVIEQALRPLFSYLGALTIPTGVYAATGDFGGEGTPDLADRMRRAAAELATLVIGGSLHRPTEDQEVAPFADLLAATSAMARVPGPSPRR